MARHSKSGSWPSSEISKRSLSYWLQIGVSCGSQQYLAIRHGLSLMDDINSLNTAREEFVKEKREELAQQSGRKTLDRALAEAIRSQAAEKAFTFEGE